MNKIFIAKRASAPIALPLLVCLAGTSGLTHTDVAHAAASQSARDAAVDGPIISQRVGQPQIFPLSPGATYSFEEGSDLVQDEVAGETLTVRALRPGRVTLLIKTPGKPDQRSRIRITEARRIAGASTAPASAPAPIQQAPALPALSAPSSTALPTGFLSPTTTTVEPQISSSIPQPSRLPSGSAPFPSNPRNDARAAEARARARRGESRNSIPAITQGLARLLRFNSNILAVFFSDVNVMDARAINARTIAVTGIAPGRSTLAVFVSRYEGDAVGQAMIYNINVEPPVTQDITPVTQDAAAVESAIRTALGDPRIAVSVFRAPSGALAARLTGSVRDTTEIAAAIQTARLFVSEVINGVILDPYSPSLAQALSPTTPVTTEGVWQEKLRRITGNDSIEIVPLPTGLAVKAEVDSAADADALHGLLSSLNRRVIPFIVVRGGATNPDGTTSKYYASDRPVLNGEDAEITRQLHEVTGIRTVSVVRTAQNALAVYGTVRNRTEYDTVRRYALLLPQLASLNQTPQVAQSTQLQQYSYSYSVPGRSPIAGSGINAPATQPLISPQLAGQPEFGVSAQVVPGAGAATGGAGAVGGATGGTGAVGGVTGGAGATGGAGSTAVPGSVTTPPGLPALSATTPNTNGVFPNQTNGINGINPGGNVPGLLPGAGNFVPFAGAAPFPVIPGSTPGNIWATPEAGGVPSVATAQAPGATDAPTLLNAPSSRANQPNSGYRFPSQIQMFVRVLDDEGNMIRRVTAETSIVEIRRDALRNLGVQAGSVQILTQTITPGTATSPPILQRTVDPTLRQGVFTGSNGFIGLEPFNILDPIRAQVNALYQRGDARILSQPNLSAVEGADAQIVIGGERPVPASVAGGGGAVGQSVTFRRFGIILTMRPTVTDDDTIIMQIRADITSLDTTSGITLNGSLIPGESVRSIDTTITVREGDVLVMGGIITNDRRETTSRVPILSSLPILGNLFKSRRFENNETELAIVMTPRILRQAASQNTKAAVERVPALPELPSNQDPQNIFEFGGQPQ